MHLLPTNYQKSQFCHSILTVWIARQSTSWNYLKSTWITWRPSILNFRCRNYLYMALLWSYSAFPPPLSLAPLLCRSSVHAGPEWFFPARWLHERLAFLLSHRLSEWVTVNQCAQRLDVAAERSWLLQYSWTSKGACRYKRRFVSGFLVMMIGTLLN